MVSVLILGGKAEYVGTEADSLVGSLWWRKDRLILVKSASNFLSEITSQNIISPDVTETEINKGPN